jgi:LytS/YehU family sensor histidine kinase
MQYAYKMDGIDRDWIYSDRRYLSYSGIPPGKYLLHIKAINGTGVMSNEISLRIIIHPPFWKTWWFIATCIVAGIALIVVVFRYRVTQIKREERLKTDFNKKMAEVEMKALRAQMNPHFLFNCLNSINRYIVINDTVKASSYLTKFSKLIRLILDNSSSDTTTLDSEITLLKLYIEMESMRFDGKFTFSIDIDTTLRVDTVIIPTMIIQPYVENAIWHGLLNKGDSGQLMLKFIDKGLHELEVIIEDNGVGREKAKELKRKNSLKNKSFGMQITNDRIKVLNQLYDAAAHVKIKDLINKDGTPAGTRVILHIPYDKMKNNSSQHT